MKTITIRQPWAGLIIAGIKNIENRTWPTSYRGQIAIHAAASYDSDEFDDAEKICSGLGIDMSQHLAGLMLTGQVIGVVNLSGIFVPRDPGMGGGRFRFLDPADAGRVDFPVHLDWYNWDGYGWILQAPRPISPIPYKGRLGLYDIPLPELEEK